MAVEERPVDAGVAIAKGKDDPALVEWWKQRLALVAAVPTDVARAGALVPMLREIGRLPDAERRRVTRALIAAWTALPADQTGPLLAARRLAWAIDPEVVRRDSDLVKALAPEVPGGEQYASAVERR